LKNVAGSSKFEYGVVEGADSPCLGAGGRGVLISGGRSGAGGNVAGENFNRCVGL